MQLRAPAILLAARPHGETAVVARLLTEEAGVVAGYVAGGRGRQLRPVVIPGNLVEADVRARVIEQRGDRVGGRASIALAMQLAQRLQGIANRHQPLGKLARSSYDHEPGHVLGLVIR